MKQYEKSFMFIPSYFPSLLDFSVKLQTKKKFRHDKFTKRLKLLAFPQLHSLNKAKWIAWSVGSAALWKRGKTNMHN